MRDRFPKRSSALGVCALAVTLCGCAKAFDVDHLDGGQLATGAAGIGAAGSAGLASTAGRGAAGNGSVVTGRAGAGGSGVVTGRAGASGAAGRGGRVPTGGAGTTPATGGNTGTGAVSHNIAACTPCPAGTSLGGMLEACCTSDNKCGVDLSSLVGTATCAEQNAPGAQTAACPTMDYMGFFTIQGCCRTEGICGLVIDQIAPLGCASASDVAASLGTTIMPTRCTP